MMKKFVLKMVVLALVCLTLLQMAPMKSQAATELSVTVDDYTFTLTHFRYESKTLDKTVYTIDKLTKLNASFVRQEGSNLLFRCRVYYRSPLIGETNIPMDVTVPITSCAEAVRIESAQWNSNATIEATFRVTRPAKAHTGTHNCTTTAACTVCGVKCVGTCNYQWQQENGRHWQQCANNASHKTGEGTCSGGTATCSTQAKCSTCKNSYGNTNSANHNTSVKYENGFCPNGCYEPAKLVDGAYQIANAGNLFWFAKEVNSGDYDANAVLTTDIDLEGRQWTTICSTDLYYQTTTYSNAVYSGTFDGQGYGIRNYTVKGTSGVKCSVGLFGTTLGATVKNLGVDNVTFDLNGATDVRAAAIVGQMLPGTLIENCYVTNSTLTPKSYIVGGIAACNYGGTIKNCYTYNVAVSGHERCGNLVSDTRGDISSTDRPGAVINCYTDAARVAGTQSGGQLSGCGEKVTKEQFASGEIAYLLGEGFGQTCGEGLPACGGAKVYRIENSGCTYYGQCIYSNDATTEFNIAHTFSKDGNGFCSLCNSYEPAPLVDGCYEISNAGQLFWFAQQINNGSMGQFYAKLVNDVTFGTSENGKWVVMSVPESTSTGSVFDGDGYTLHIGQQSDGLFRSFNYATVKNLTIKGSIHANIGEVGAIAGSAYRTRFEQVVSYVDVRNDGGNAGGIVGYYGGQHNGDVKSLITDCAVYADVTGGNAGGLVGKGWNGTQYFDITNCVYVGNVEGTKAGAIVGYQSTDSNTCRFTNIYWKEADGLGFYGERDTSNQIYTNTEEKSLEAFKSGEIAYKLGEAWGQTLGTDNYPIPGGAAVYSFTDCTGTTHYANTAQEGGHNFDEKGQCTTCHQWDAILSIDSVTLRPNCAGLYFGANFQLGSNLKAVHRGIVVSLYDQAPTADCTDSVCYRTEGTTSILVTNILRTFLKDDVNAARANMNVYARAYVELEDGTYIYSDVVIRNLQQVAEAADAKWDTLEEPQRTAFAAMYQKFETVMSTWNLPKVKEN